MIRCVLCILFKCECICCVSIVLFCFCQAEDGIRDIGVTGVQTCALPISGLDIGWSEETSNGKEVLRDRLVEAGRRGQKTSAGYYDYDENRVPSPSPEIEKIILEFSEKNGKTRREISDEEILIRCIYPMINEGAKILEEGIAIRSRDIDVVWVYGYGWPIYRGGPMFYGDSIGLPKIVAKMRELKEQTGDPMWEPAALMVKLAEEGKGFKDFA